MLYRTGRSDINHKNKTFATLWYILPPTIQQQIFKDLAIPAIYPASYRTHLRSFSEILRPACRSNTCRSPSNNPPKTKQEISVYEPAQENLWRYRTVDFRKLGSQSLLNHKISKLVLCIHIFINHSYLVCIRC